MTQVPPWGTVAPKRFSHSDLGDLYKNESVQKYLEQLMEELRDIRKKQQYLYLSDAERKALLQRHKELLPLANVSETLEEATKELEEVLSLLHSE